MKKTSLLWIIGFFLLSQNSFAGGSSYSRYGKGDILYFGGSRAYALGGCGIATIGNNYLNQFNPAGLSRLLITQFSGSFENSTISSSTQNGSSKYNTFGIQSFFIAIPISIEDGIALSLEYTPYSQVAYAIRSTSEQAGYLRTNTFYGNGGLATLAAGLSLSITNDIHIGAKVVYDFGRTEQYIKTDFTNSDILDTEIEHSYGYHGFGSSFGIIVERIGKHLNIKWLEPLTLGLTFSPPLSLSTDYQAYYPTYDTTITLQSGYSDLPLSFGAGMSYNLNKSYILVSDIQAQQWDRAKIFGQPEASLRNSIRFGIGCERVPNRQETSFWKRSSYRVGAYYHSTYYDINGKGIDELGVTAGIGFPIRMLGKLDLGFQYSTRGVTDQNLQKDSFYRISLGLTVNERWFLKFEED
ncbi:MAG TPA: hypothetical protein PK595_02450 [Bacteroidota bacterium]|nr:hypothetical protein [Bacteroidota bacterium]